MTMFFSSYYDSVGFISTAIETWNNMHRKYGPNMLFGLMLIIILFCAYYSFVASKYSKK